MLTLNFNPFPTIFTERLVLRKITDGDVEQVFFLRSDRDVLKYIDKTPVQTMQEAEDWIKMVSTGIDNNDMINWSISLKNEPTLIGNISFWRIMKEHYRAEIGYALHTAYHRQGIMNEAIQPVIKYGFEEMKLHSIEARINPANTPSASLLEKNGFVREGYFKEDYYFNGKFGDTGVYSLRTTISQI